MGLSISEFYRSNRKDILNFINLYQRTYSNLSPKDDNIRGILSPYGDFSYYLGATINAFNPFWRNKNFKKTSKVLVFFPTGRVRNKKALISVQKIWKTPLGELNCDTAFAYEISKNLDKAYLSELNVENEIPLKYILPIIRYYNSADANIIPIAIPYDVASKTVEEILQFVFDHEDTYFIICVNLLKSKSHSYNQTIIESLADAITSKNLIKLNKISNNCSFPNGLAGLVKFCNVNEMIINSSYYEDNFVYKIRKKRLLGATSFIVKNNKK